MFFSHDECQSFDRRGVATFSCEFQLNFKKMTLEWVQVGNGKV